MGGAMGGAMGDGARSHAAHWRATRPISTPHDLARQMARLTHELRERVAAALASADHSPALRALVDACHSELSVDLTPAQVADTLAQIAAYTLLTARYLHAGPAPFSRHELASLPAPHPFLQRLRTTLGGSALDGEPFMPAVEALVHLLATADIAALFAHHGNPPGDPLIHFYEAFLRAYDLALRGRHGLYVTPEPVVSYIVRSVDSLLADELGVAGGLASLAGVACSPCACGEPERADARWAVVLDPACGTGAFLAGALECVLGRVHDRARSAGGRAPSPGHVRERLLARVGGCELLPTPYLIAHLILGVRLARLDPQTAERSARDGAWADHARLNDRLNIALGNALDCVEMWPERASGVADGEVLVILGNPPYASHSANASGQIAALLRGVDPLDRGPTGSYFAVDGAPLAERNLKWLNDDYVKFLRYAQWRIERAGQGILAFVTSSGYLDNPTFRAMRRSLMRSFDAIYVLDLHGNGKRGERGPSGARDENIFAIQSGVAIGLFVRGQGSPGPTRDAALHYAELWGARSHKYAWLAAHSVTDTPWTRFSPPAPLYGFTPQDAHLEAEYMRGWPLRAIMPEHSLGVLSKRDALVVGFTPEEVLRRVAAFADATLSDERCAQSFGLPRRDKDGWDLGEARAALAGNVRPELVQPVLYRPFDTRYIYYHPAVIARPNLRVMRHLERGNVALVIGRQGAATGAASWDVAFATSRLTDHNVFRRGGGTVFPLYLSPSDAARPADPTANIAPAFVAALCSGLGMAWQRAGSGDRERTIGPEDVLAYMYAVFYAPSFRARYADHLKTDFPRLPLTSDAELFRELSALGARLLALHLTQSPPAARMCYSVSGGNRVERVRYTPPDAAGEPGRVWLNATQYVEGVTPAVWESSVGGYRIAQKWLTDRTGRTLAQDDLDTYRDALAALAETRALTQQLDAAIARHGGWPFTGASQGDPVVRRLLAALRRQRSGAATLSVAFSCR